MKHNTDDEGERHHAVSQGPLMPCLEPMQLNSVFRDTLFGEEICNLDPLVTLKLNDLTHLLIVNEIAVASELLFEGFEEFLGIILLGETLQRGQGLSSVPLLNADVEVILCGTHVLVAPERIALISKRIVSFQVLHVAHAMKNS